MTILPAVRLLAPILIAVILGPLIPALAMCLFALGDSIIDPLGSASVADLLGLFVFYMVFAYVIGGPIALIAGILVSIWMIWRVPSALVVTAAAVIATGIFLGIGALGYLGEVEQTNARSNFLFTEIFAVVAALGCWFATQPLRQIGLRGAS